jgi:DNA-binding winged helix-turn-helix (wHTH) protein/tetratricopeptide (TPR) repeat protein/TolB-like protein
MQSNPGSPRTEPPSPSAPSSAQAAVLFEFENFRLDPANRLFTCEGKEILLPGRVFDALLLFVRKPGALITKEEMLTTVWHDSFVEESNLTVAISTLRRALNEDPQDRRYIQTVARRGYRFVAEVREVESTPRATKPVAPPPRSEDVYPSEPVASASLEPTASALSDSSAKPHARRWALLITLAVLLAGLLAGAWHLLKPRSPIRTLAVLPFTLDSASAHAASDTPDEVVLLGMTDGLISRLDGDLVVRPTGSVLRYSTGATVDPVAAGREQGVDAILSGSVEIASSRETLHLRLLRVRDGFVLWQDSVSGTPDSLPQLEQNAGEAVAHELHRLGAISAPPKPNVTTHPDGPAYQLYLRGRYFWNRRTVDGLRKSTDYFRQSIDADPNYAPAYAGLADSYALLASFSVEPGSSANADARSAALSAIHLDPTLAEPHASLGMIYFFTDWNLAAAEQEFEHAIQLNPNYATAHHWYALDLAAMGRFPQSLYEIHLAQKLDPLSLIIGTNVGWIEYLSHDNAAALVALNRVLELDPNFVRARTRLGMVEMATGDYAAAVTNLTQALALSGNPEDRDPWVEGLLGDAEARAGNRAAAEKVLAELHERAASHYVPPISRALVLIGLGRNAEAIEALGKAVDDHSTSMVYARVDPSLDPLRTDPAFQGLLGRMKL